MVGLFAGLGRQLFHRVPADVLFVGAPDPGCFRRPPHAVSSFHVSFSSPVRFYLHTTVCFLFSTFFCELVKSLHQLPV